MVVLLAVWFWQNKIVSFSIQRAFDCTPVSTQRYQYTNEEQNSTLIPGIQLGRVNLRDWKGTLRLVYGKIAPFKRFTTETLGFSGPYLDKLSQFTVKHSNNKPRELTHLPLFTRWPPSLRPHLLKLPQKLLGKFKPIKVPLQATPSRG